MGLQSIPFRFIVTLAIVAISCSVTRATNAPNRPKDWQARIIRDFKALYSPLLKETGRRLEIQLNAEDKSVVASAGTDGKVLRVIIHGGFLDSPRISPDGFRFMLCHEMGHLLGGAPRRTMPMDWDGPVAPDGLLYISAEGQADHYASMICFRRLAAGQARREAPAQAQPSQSLLRQCERVWGKGTDDSVICVRTALGGLNLLQAVKEFPISFETADTTEAPELIRDQLPPRQCRLDTVLAGALCERTGPLELDFTNALTNDCADKIGWRPGCWFPDKLRRDRH